MFDNVGQAELQLETLFEELEVCVQGSFEWHVVMEDILSIVSRSNYLLDKYLDRI